MKIPDLLSPKDVMIDVPGSNKRLLLQEFAATAAESLGLHVDQVAPYLLKREDLGSTGIGKGVAIPHARLPDLKRPYGLLAKLKAPVEFDAIDEQAVDIIFVLLLPAAAESGAARAGGPDLETTGESRPIAGRENCCRALCGDRLTASTTGNQLSAITTLTAASYVISSDSGSPRAWSCHTGQLAAFGAAVK